MREVQNVSDNTKYSQAEEVKRSENETQTNLCVDSDIDKLQGQAEAWEIVFALIHKLDPKMLRRAASGLNCVTKSIEHHYALVSEEEKTLRKLLAFAYSGINLYGDDGELQDGAELPIIDYVRDTVKQIEQKIEQRAINKLIKAGVYKKVEPVVLLPTQVAAAIESWKLIYDEAVKYASLYGCTIRITKEDRTPCVVTRDVKPNRINIELEDGLVVKAYIG